MSRDSTCMIPLLPEEGCSRGERGGGRLASLPVCQFRRDCIAHRRGAAPGAGGFLCSPKESHQRKGNPRFAAATSFPRAVPCATRSGRAAAQLAHRRRNCTRIRREVPTRNHMHTRLAQCSPTTPCLICVARRRTGAPTTKNGLRHDTGKRRIAVCKLPFRATNIS